MKSLIAENLNIDKSYIHNFLYQSGLTRRSLLTYTLIYSFDIIIPLSDTDASSAAELSTEFTDELDEDSDFAEAVADALPDVVISDVYVSTSIPTSAPVTASTGDDDDDDEEGVSTAGVLVILLPILGAVLILVVGYTLYKKKLDKRWNGTKGEDRSDAYGLELGENDLGTLEIESSSADTGGTALSVVPSSSADLGGTTLSVTPSPLSPSPEDDDQDKFALAMESSAQEL
mmetsp:Transcript_27766/g.38038  ORF Transcript_27766/g.38038 Transcript_27766/m.38038 type:complete len:231 (-) Transcript_27766:400-1092(-)